MAVFADPATSVPAFEGLLFAVSLGAGLVGAVLGLGGGIVVVPALTLGFGVNIRYAIGASIVSVIATSSGAAASYVRDHITNLRVAIFLEVATTLGALSGGFLADRFSRAALFRIFAGMLMFSAALMFVKRKQSEELAPGHSSRLARRLGLPSEYPDAQKDRAIAYGVRGVGLGFFLMVGAGLISGLLGVGSGALKVPAMDGAMRLPIKVSSATSNFMIGVTAAASAGLYYMRGSILPILAAPVSLGVLCGSFIGAKWMPRLKSESLRVAFFVVLCVLALQMALRGKGGG
ncbi:MAG: sulfite exporter TauE/SafE family protein [Bdellovibrionales bacterium]|nr:sulfite exporter TauE/SafE family protein [Bdellovibrionales bacterium]